MVPVDTCYRMLDMFCWVFAVTGTLASVTVTTINHGMLLHNPIYYAVLAAIVANWVVTIFRGLPFLVRYLTFAIGFSILELGPTLGLGIIPNMALILLVLVTSVALFFGTAKAMWAVGVFFLVHMAIAWGWVNGSMPIFIDRKEDLSAYMDVTSPRVWFRVMITASGLIMTVLYMMRFMLNDTRRALHGAEQALQRLAVEQDGRERAERAAREVQKFDALGRLAAGVAHDVNNALCVIKCYSSIMAEKVGDRSVILNGVKAIDVATLNAEQLTHHLLSFSRSDASLKSGISNLADVVRMEAKTLERMLPQSIAVKTDVCDPVFVPLSRGSLQEVIMNMAVNARDAMPEGGALEMKVSLDHGPEGASTGMVRLEIADTGIGIDQATQERIFEPFFTTKPSGSGTGLGLSMVYGLVSGAGGTIAVESAVGKGTRFIIRLPKAEPVEEVEEASTKKILTETRCRVLVAEDQAQLLALIDRVLTKEEFPVTTSVDGNEAMYALSQPGEPYGLLILDGIMPGSPTAKIIERGLELNRDCRIIVASAHTLDELALRGIRMNEHCHYLQKPFDVDQLRESVNLALGHAS
ncbi:MAG: ATP-binding protein [Opitutaceae bacterium]